MLIYGDMERIEDAASVRGATLAVLGEADAAPPGLARHALLVEAFIGAAELAGAVVDAGWEARGFDAASPGEDAAMRLVCALAELVGRSWENGFRAPGELIAEASQLVAGVDCSGALRLRQAEGFAIYALYPESYWEAARGSGLAAGTRVIGIRSIGLGLSALVASALKARPPVTLRPTGHPFARRIEAAPALRGELLADPGACFAVVDEGPGLSGSSFAAVGDFLREGGVSSQTIRFFPSHGNGPGSQASVETRALWQETPALWRSFEATVLDAASPLHRLDRWVADLVGPLAAPLEDISGGGWRAQVPGGAEAPAVPQRERRKFLARTVDRKFLVKFAGLAAAGRKKLETARRLHEAGFCAEPAGLCHGMLVERWIDHSPAQRALPRKALIALLAAYLAFRAKHLPPVNEGASLSRLREMAVFNTGEALGQAAADRLKDSLARAGGWSGRVRPVNTDNRLHRWEWLTDRNGAWRKTDALDHSSDHDLIGCQDIAWDVAGAIVEFELNAEEAESLRASVSELADRAVEESLVRRLTPCYLAFQLGSWTMALNAADPAAAIPIRRERDRYAERLRSWLNRLG